MRYSEKTMSLIQHDVLIIGAGICGLVAAYHLKKQGYDVGVMDKSRGVGGRMATRRLPALKGQTPRVDHGAQYFTLRHADALKLSADWETEGLIKSWPNLKPDETVYICPNGMTTLPKALGEEQQLYLGQKAIFIQACKEGPYRYKIRTETYEEYYCNTLVITSPVPQSLELLSQSDFKLTTDEKNQLTSVQYAPCIALLGTTSIPTHLGKPGGHQVKGHPVISWIADNEPKGVSPIGPSLTIQATPEWSRKFWEETPSVQEEHLIDAASEWVSPNAWEHTEIKTWRYALVESPLSQNHLSLTHDPHVLLAGDGFTGPRIENAILSGLSVSKHIISNHPMSPPEVEDC